MNTPDTPLKAYAEKDLVHEPGYHSDPTVIERGQRGMPRRFPGVTLTFYWTVQKAMRDAARAAKSPEALSDTYFVTRSNDLLRAAERCGTDVEITGLDNVTEACVKGPVVFVGNHMSTLETFTLPGILLPFTPLTFVLKESLMGYPLLGRILNTLGPVIVSRENPREDLRVVLEEGMDRLRRGRSVVVFPQTTRRSDFDAAAFNTLGVKLAARAGVPALPLALRTDFWSAGRFIKDFGPIRPDRPIRFAFGEALEVTRATTRDAHQQTVAFITEKLQSWNVPTTT